MQFRPNESLLSHCFKSEILSFTTVFFGLHYMEEVLKEDQNQKHFEKKISV